MHVARLRRATAALAALVCAACWSCAAVRAAVPPTALLQWHAQSPTCALSSTDAVVQFYTSMCLRGDVVGLFNASLYVKASCTASSAVSVAFFSDAACSPSLVPVAPNMTFGLACTPLNASSGVAASAAGAALPLYVLGACGGVPSAYDLTQTAATVHSYVGGSCSGIIGARAYLPTACVRYANSSVQRTCSAVGNTTSYVYAGSSTCGGTAGPPVSVQNARCQALPLANGTLALPFARLICGYDAFVDSAAPAGRAASLVLLATLVTLASVIGA